ncbi:unnamed protein product [Miscanthus lutarioriparius]|uniref:Uncharacterized protein n=1 Tax=Miscanthus lutarioriparius TaxID=422564 RepID=A0A811MET7_9POAL|nr:unnamed protein product [Miscanthus lutarioriparius]
MAKEYDGTSACGGIKEQVSVRSCRRDFNSLVILATWTLWNHHNICVFDGSLSAWLELHQRRAAVLEFGQGLKYF